MLGQPGTRSLLGPGALDLDQRQGGRIRANLWIDDARSWSVDAGAFFLGSSTFKFVANSNTFPVISRPVFVVSEGREDAETVAFPGFATGQLRIDATSSFWGADANLTKRICASCDRNFDLFAGYRYLQLSEMIRIQESITAGTGTPDPAGTQVTVVDRFATRNQFNGGQFGAHFEQRWNRFSFDLRGCLALGVTDQSINIDGSQVKIRPGESAQTFQGGLLATRSNIGDFKRDRFSFVPEAGLNIGYQITSNLRGIIGYNLLYWDGVVRPGEQIDRGVDLNQIPNSRPSPALSQPRPRVLFNESSLWVQGVSVGVVWLW